MGAGKTLDHMALMDERDAAGKEIMGYLSTCTTSELHNISRIVPRGVMRPENMPKHSFLCHYPLAHTNCCLRERMAASLNLHARKIFDMAPLLVHQVTEIHQRLLQKLQQ